MSAEAVRYAASAGRAFADDLAAFVRFPSVGADSGRRAAVTACASWLADRLRRAGLAHVRVVETAGNPIVCAVWQQASDAPTVVVYGHYDVQPAEPLSAWRTPPFTPVRRGDDLIARGACDDKGPLLCHVLAIESELQTHARLPVNVVCIFEGEEEHGSPHLRPFLRACQRWLRPDVAVMSDTRMRGWNWPALVVGTRGALSLRVVLRRSGGDVHSGQFGGAVPDAAQALCRVICGLHDTHLRIAVPGLYDRVRRRSPDVRARWSRCAPSDAEIIRDAGTRTGAGEAGFSAYERTTLRPALTVTGLQAGYAGHGSKSAVPAVAEARLNLRLVDDQEPHEIERLIRRRLRALTPNGVALTVTSDAGSRPVRMDPGNPAIRMAAEALRRAFGRAPVLLRSGGTIPVVDDLQRVFGVPAVLMGFALPDDRMHGPNEKVSLSTLERGTVACIELLDLASGLRARGTRAA
jgi:acetylornithine deacetylase/succinyl-diaminopimelate desuccinylase-like protein